MTRRIVLTVLFAAMLIAACRGSDSGVGTRSPIAAVPPTTTVIIQGTVQPGPTVLSSEAEAQALVPFSILVPAAEALPSEMQLHQVLWWPTDEQGLETVVLGYQDGDREVTITETWLGSNRLQEPSQTHEIVTVREHTAYSVSIGSCQSLIWAEGSVSITLAGSCDLTREEVLRLADGLEHLAE